MARRGRVRGDAQSVGVERARSVMEMPMVSARASQHMFTLLDL